MSYFTQGKHFLQALAVCFRPFPSSLGGVLPNYLQTLAVCFRPFSPSLGGVLPNFLQA